jgi:hypothetical protein
MLRVAAASCIAFALVLFGAGAAQAAPVPPAVEGQAVSGITADDATLEAEIDPGSAPAGAYYQFQLAEFPTEFPDELSCPPPPGSGPFLPCEGPESSTALPIGHIAQSDGATTVALDLAGAGVTLQPGTTYYFRVVAAPAVESEDTTEWEDPVVGGQEQTFTTSGSSSPLQVSDEAASEITSTNATLEASIDSGTAAYYQFQLAEFPTEFPAELSCPPPPVLGLPACVGPQSADALPIGRVTGEGGTARVTLNLADAGVTLKPGATYYFEVVAAAAKPSEDAVEWEKPAVSGGLHAFATSPRAEEPQQPAGGGLGGQQGTDPAPAVLPRHHRHHRRHTRHRHSRNRHGGLALDFSRIAR